MVNWLELVQNLETITWTKLFYLVLAILISSFALRMALLLFGGKVGWKRTLGVNICASLGPILLYWFFPNLPVLLTFLLVIFAYQYFFQLTFLKAIGAWFMQYLFAAAIIFALIFSGWFV